VHIIIDVTSIDDHVDKELPKSGEARGRDGLLTPAAISNVCAQMHPQDPGAWTHAVDLRPNMEHL
jgi:hypothetical protein